MTDLVQLKLDELTPHPENPRRAPDPEALAELARSVKAQGVLEPLLVRKDGKGGYQIVAGERRYRAAKRAGLATVPAIVRELTDAAVVEIQLVENVEREDLAPLERANAYKHYLDTTGATQGELAKRLGVTAGHVSQFLQLLELPKAAKDLIARGRLTPAHGREIARLAAHPEERDKLLRPTKQAAEWGTVTTRDLKQDVDEVLGDIRERARRAKERAAAKAKAAQASPTRKKKAAPKKKSWWELEQERQARRQAEREAAERVLPGLLKPRAPALAAQAQSVVRIVAKLPPAIGRELVKGYYGRGPLERWLHEAVESAVRRRLRGAPWAVKLGLGVWLVTRGRALTTTLTRACKTRVAADRRAAKAKGRVTRVKKARGK